MLLCQAATTPQLPLEGAVVVVEGAEVVEVEVVAGLDVVVVVVLVFDVVLVVEVVVVFDVVELVFVVEPPEPPLASACLIAASYRPFSIKSQSQDPSMISTLPSERNKTWGDEP